MSAIKCEGFILRRTRFSETSLIVSVFTRELGLIDAIAKGARRPTSQMRGHLDLFNFEEVMIWERARASLDLLTESEIIAEYCQLRKNSAAFSAACVIGELVTGGCMIRDPHPGTFNLLRGCLERLGDGEDPAAVLPPTIFGILSDLGFEPRLDSCACCGTELEKSSEVAFSGNRGGLVCASCRGSSGGVNFSPQLAAALRFIATGGGKARLALKSRAMLKLAGGLVRYAEDSFGRGIKSFSTFANVFSTGM